MGVLNEGTIQVSLSKKEKGAQLVTPLSQKTNQKN